MQMLFLCPCLLLSNLAGNAHGRWHSCPMFSLKLSPFCSYSVRVVPFPSFSFYNIMFSFIDSI